MPNLFSCFSASHSKPDTATNTASDTAGVKKRWAALPQKDVQILSDPGFVDVLKSAADHIEGNPRTARHVMDCLQGKRAPDNADTWLRDKNLDHAQKRICATLFVANRFGHTESASKSSLKIAYLLERLSEQKPTETPSVIEHVLPEKTAPGVDEMIADMVSKSLRQAEAANQPTHNDVAKLRPFLESQWKAVLDTCLKGGNEGTLETFNLAPVIMASVPPETGWHQVCFEALVVAIEHHKNAPLIHRLLDRAQVNLSELNNNHPIQECLTSSFFAGLMNLAKKNRETFPLLIYSRMQSTTMQALRQRLDEFLTAQNDAVPGDNTLTQWQQMESDAMCGSKKTGHYMWFAYPQPNFTAKELGLESESELSQNAQQYGIRDVYEAQMFLRDSELGKRERDLFSHLLSRQAFCPKEFFGKHDEPKFHSSTTLFAIAAQRAIDNLEWSIAPEHREAERLLWEKDLELFRGCLNRFYDGKADEKTENKLKEKLIRNIATPEEREDAKANRPNDTLPKRNPK